MPCSGRQKVELVERLGLREAGCLQSPFRCPSFPLDQLRCAESLEIGKVVEVLDRRPGGDLIALIGRRPNAKAGQAAGGAFGSTSPPQTSRSNSSIPPASVASRWSLATSEDGGPDCSASSSGLNDTTPVSMA